MATDDPMTALSEPAPRRRRRGATRASRRPTVVRERVLVMADGIRLPLVTWEPAGAVRATVIGLHAFGDFRLAFAEAGPALARRGFRVHAYDQRGFGDTRRPRTLARLAPPGARPQGRDQDPAPEATARGCSCSGESMGGGVALVATARFRPEPVDGLILVEPAVRRGIRLRLMWDVAFATLALVAPGYSRRLTRGTHAEFTPAARERLGQDPRIVRFIRADAYKGLLSLADAASASTRRLRLPTLFLYGRADGIIPLRLFEQAVRDLRPLVTALRYPEAPHLLLQTHSLEVVLDDICAWLDGAPLPASAQSVLMRSGPRPASPADARREALAPWRDAPWDAGWAAAARRAMSPRQQPIPHRSGACAGCCLPIRRRLQRFAAGGQPVPRHAAGAAEARRRRRHRLACRAVVADRQHGRHRGLGHHLRRGPDQPAAAGSWAPLRPWQGGEPERHGAGGPGRGHRRLRSDRCRPAARRSARRSSRPRSASRS